MPKKIPYLLKDDIATVILSDSSCREFILKIIEVIVKISKRELKSIKPLKLSKLKMMYHKISSASDVKKQETDVLFESNHFVWNLEVNTTKSGVMELKNFTYVSQLELRQIKSGKDYDANNFKKVIQINLDYFDYYGENKLFYNSKEMEVDLNKKSHDFYERYRINLAYLTKMNYNDVKKLNEDDLEWLLYFFVCGDNKRLYELYGENKMMRKVLEKMEDLVRTIDQTLYYDKKAFHDYVNEYNVKEARKSGREEGITTGITSVAKNMVKAGFKDQEIMSMTNLDINEIKKLRTF